VSPTQAAFASLALAHVEIVRGDLAAARKAVRGATDINLDNQRFAEETIETLYAIGDLALARTAAELSFRQYPNSVRTRVHYAHILVALGRAAEAVDMLTKQADTLSHPDALAARGHAYLAIGEGALAAADFDAALKKVPTHEPAIVGRAWFELATGDVEGATARMAGRMNAKGAPVAVATAYAATLRRGADPASRDQAKALLEKIVAGPMTPDAVRAQLELARIYRDQGEYVNAATAFEMAARNGEFEARFEGALLSLEYSKPAAGRDALETLLKDAGERRPPALVIETARAYLIMGQHDLAAALIADADKMSSVERWKLDRERGRLALRKTDFEGAATALGRALETCGTDGETFLLAVDVSMLVKGNLADRVKQLAAERLKGQPELHIINGKYLLAAEKTDEAEVEFKQAAGDLRKAKASNRRNAAADFGIALAAYIEGNSVVAEQGFKQVLDEDPTNVDALMAAADIAKGNKNKKKAYELARRAVQYNPDYAYAWQEVGQLAHELKDKKVLADAIARLTVIAPTGDELKALQALRGN
jgi:tetratricopeptide (TPR) repeat protein